MTSGRKTQIPANGKEKEITERIKVARGFGDLSENAEYDAARNEQAMNEGEILELEAKIKNAKIVEGEYGYFQDPFRKQSESVRLRHGRRGGLYPHGHDRGGPHEPTSSASILPSAKRSSAARRAPWSRCTPPAATSKWRSKKFSNKRRLSAQNKEK